MEKEDLKAQIKELRIKIWLNYLWIAQALFWIAIISVATWYKIVDGVDPSNYTLIAVIILTAALYKNADGK